jgi:hypothetical protein
MKVGVAGKGGSGEKPRKRFDARRHRWQDRVNERRTVRWVEEFLISDRRDR